MPAHIPHTYRKSTGVYYFRYVFPKSFLERFPAIGADLRFSLKTRLHAEASRGVVVIGIMCTEKLKARLSTLHYVGFLLKSD